MEEEAAYQIYEVRCNDVLEQEGVRFAAIINSEGKLTAGDSKKVLPLLKETKKNYTTL